VSIQINMGDHVSDFPTMLIKVPFKYQWATKWARNQAKLIAANVKTADKYFKSLPAKRSLTQLLADRRIWINYAFEWYGRGVRQPGSNDIGIGDLAYLRGKEGRVRHPDSRARAHRWSPERRFARS